MSNPIKLLKFLLLKSKYKYKVVSWLEELARVKDTFKLAGVTNLPDLKTDERVMGYLESRENHFKVLQKQYSLLIIFKIIVAFGLLIVGGFLVLNEQMNIGQFIAAEIIILLVIDSSEKIIINLENIYDVLTSLEKLGQVTDMELDNISDNSTLNHDIKTPIVIELNNLSFSYPGRTKPVIKNINYTFEANKIYCITGDNGSGKSTLIHLISGLYQPQAGNVCINNLPILNYDILKLYQFIGNGLSEETIFEGSFLENITLGRDFVTIDDVLWAIEKVHLSEYVKGLALGLDTPIEISGNKLSKSIIQRIIIARSIVNKPKLLLLENHLDFIEDKQREKIIDFLTDQSNGWTFIGISNNKYLQEKSDIVIQMTNGEILN